MFDFFATIKKQCEKIKMEKRKIERIAQLALPTLFFLLLISPSYAVDVVAIVTVKDPLQTILSITGNNGTEVFNPQVVAISSDPGDSDVNYTLWRNNQLISSSFGPANLVDNSILAAGTYTYVFNNTAGKDYKQNETGTTFTVIILSNSTTTSTTQIVNSGGGGVIIYPTSTTTTSTTPSSSKTTSTTTTIPTTPTTVPTTTTTVPATNPITGFTTFVSSPSGISLLLSLIVVTALFIVFYKKRRSKKKVEEKVIGTSPVE